MPYRKKRNISLEAREDAKNLHAMVESQRTKRKRVKESRDVLMPKEVSKHHKNEDSIAVDLKHVETSTVHSVVEIQKRQGELTNLEKPLEMEIPSVSDTTHEEIEKDLSDIEIGVHALTGEKEEFTGKNKTKKRHKRTIPQTLESNEPVDDKGQIDTVSQRQGELKNRTIHYEIETSNLEDIEQDLCDLGMVVTTDNHTQRQHRIYPQFPTDADTGLVDNTGEPPEIEKEDTTHKNDKHTAVEAVFVNTTTAVNIELEENINTNGQKKKKKQKRKEHEGAFSQSVESNKPDVDQGIVEGEFVEPTTAVDIEMEETVSTRENIDKNGQKKKKKKKKKEHQKAFPQSVEFNKPDVDQGIVEGEFVEPTPVVDIEMEESVSSRENIDKNGQKKKKKKKRKEHERAFPQSEESNKPDVDQGIFEGEFFEQTTAVDIEMEETVSTRENIDKDGQKKKKKKKEHERAFPQSVESNMPDVDQGIFEGEFFEQTTAVDIEMEETVSTRENIDKDGQKKKKKKKKKEHERAFPQSVESNMPDVDQGIFEGEFFEQTTAVDIEMEETVSTRENIDKDGQKKKKKKKKKEHERTFPQSVESNMPDVDQGIFEGEFFEQTTAVDIEMKETVSTRENIDKDGQKKKKKKKKKEHERTFPQSVESNKSEDHKGLVDDVLVDLTSEVDPMTVDEAPNQFDFNINEDVWKNIKPETKTYAGKGREVRKMKGDWTDVFAENTNKVHKGCVLVFKYQNVRQPRSRKISTPFLRSMAQCSGQFCAAKFEFTIQYEPLVPTEVTVHCSKRGRVKHSSEEVNRRNLKGSNRKAAANEMKTKTPIAKFYADLARADTSQMQQGNFSSVPNTAVLRKVISEQIQKENLHSNTMAEVKLLKESYESQNDPYIRDIGLDPFCIILFSDKQIDLLKKFSSESCLHIDATGSIIQNIPDQKRPYLYSVVLRPNPDSPPLSVADMLTTQHTIPRIELFFATVQRAVKLTGQNIRFARVETDFSYALMQAALSTFNKMEIKTYINTCHSILINPEHHPELTVLHLCAAHIWRDFARQLKKYCSRMNPQMRFFLYKTFAVLQNVVDMKEAYSAFEDICRVLLSKTAHSNVKGAIDRLQQRMEGITPESEEESEEEDTNGPPELAWDSQNVTSKTIRSSSPFDKDFERILSKEKNKLEKDEQRSSDINEFFCPQALKCLVERFMYLFPLWSGVMLNYNDQADSTIMTRETNSEVENWFKVLKKDMNIGKPKRPAKFVLALRKLVNGRITEIEFPGARKKKTSKAKKKRGPDIEISLSEETWKKSKKGASKYQPPAKTFNVVKSGNIPKVAKWGGTVEGRSLVNTCTIDNALTILHLMVTEDEHAMNHFRKQKSEVFETLMTAFTLMSEECFPAAKLVWVNFTNKVTDVRSRRTNLHGDEAELFFDFLEPEWRSKTTSTCTEPTCPDRYLESGEQQGIVASVSKAVHSPQQIIDNWLCHESPCWSSTDDAKAKDDLEILTKTCPGHRNVVRTILQDSPCLVVRVYEVFQANRINLHQILDCKVIKVQGRVYRIAGCTLHSSSGDHYCAIICSEKHGNMWYDGLKGSLQPFFESSQSWVPSHVVYCLV